MSSGTAVAPIKTEAPKVAAPPLRVSFSWAFAGNVVYALCQWGLLSVFAKLGSPTIVGQFALGLAISAPIFMLTNLQLRGIQATDARTFFSFGDYFCARCYGTVLALIIVTVFVVASHYDRSTCMVILLLAAAKSIESFADVIAGLLQQRERLDQVAIGLILRGSVSLLTVLTVFYVTRSIVLAVLALAMTWLFVIGSYDLRVMFGHLGKAETLRSKIVTTKRLVMLSLPMGIVSCLFSLRVNIPRFAIEHTGGNRELGLFASVAYLVTTVDIIMNSLGQSAAPRLSRMFATGDIRGFKRLVGKFVIFGFVMLIVGIPGALFFGREILTILYTPEYGKWSYLLVAMVGISAVNAAASFMGYGLTAAREFRVQVPIVAASVLTAAVVSFLCVPKFGIYGAAIALFACVLVQFVANFLVLHRILERAHKLLPFGADSLA